MTTTYNDIPFRIKIEGETIRLSSTKTSPTTIRLSWNIPSAAVNCDLAYNGIIITAGTSPASIRSAPIDGEYYTADNTVDTDLHAGDNLDHQLVVAAFYDDQTTTFVDIPNLDPKKPYYFSAYAVDKQLAYHTEGAHAYSLVYGNNEGLDAVDGPGFQIIKVGSENEPSTFDIKLFEPTTTSVRGSESTGLLPGTNYTFKIKCTLDDVEKDEIIINGTNAATYNDLVEAINNAIEQLENAPQTAGFPNQNSYYYDENKGQLFLYDGQFYTEIPVINESTDPTIPLNNDYWFNTLTEEFNRYNTTLSTWEAQTYFTLDREPIAENLEGIFWFNGTQAYVWEGNVWCEKPTIIQNTDPTSTIKLPHGTYWFNTSTSTMMQLTSTADCNTTTQTWTAVDVIYTSFDPNTLSEGDYWFNETNNILYVLDNTTTWIPVSNNVTISESEPINPVNNDFWYNPTTESLLQYNATLTSWEAPINQVTTNPALFISWPTDPLDRESCNLWWDANNNNLYIWNSINDSWEQVTSFYEQATDPTQPLTLADCTIWINGDIIQKWNGIEWVDINAFTYASNILTLPATMSSDYYFNNTEQKWYRWNVTEWMELTNEITELDSDPYALTPGTFWYNTSLNTLQQLVSLPGVWSPVAFSTTDFTPQIGYTFYNILTNQLLEWDGTQYKEITGCATVGLSSTGNLIFQSAATGSGAFVCVEDLDLFKNLSLTTKVNDAYEGTDGLNPEPTYAIQGIGTDGTPDERRELIYSIRAQLGEPVVKVELTDYQLDTCITGAIESLRKRSSISYLRKFFVLDTERNKQIYKLTNDRIGFNEIVTVTGAYRYRTSHFGNAGAGDDAFAQQMINYIYQLNTFDLISYHLVHEYIELYQQVFAAYLTFTWDESSREIFFHQNFSGKERLLLDVVVERTEQDLIKDRYIRTWIERYAIGSAQLILSEIRGKYATLPGAGGGVALNSAELRTSGEANLQMCYDQIDDFITNNPEHHGYESSFLLG